MGFSRQEYWRGLPFPTPGDLPVPGIETDSASPALAGRLFTSSTTWETVQSLSRVQLFETPRTAARQASLSITNSRSPPKPMSIVPVMPSNHLILCCPLLLLPSIFPNIRVFSNELALCIRWPKYWISASTSVFPMNTQDWFLLGWTGWISLQSKSQESSPKPQFKSINSSALSFLYSPSHVCNFTLAMYGNSALSFSPVLAWIFAAPGWLKHSSGLLDFQLYQYKGKLIFNRKKRLCEDSNCWNEFSAWHLFQTHLQLLLTYLEAAGDGTKHRMCERRS